MQEELRVWKQKYALLQAQVDKQQNKRNEHESQIKKMQEENQQIKQKIELMPKPQVVQSHQDELKQKQEAELKQRQEAVMQKQQQRMKDLTMEKQIKEHEEQLKQLKATLREKEQLNRVSNFKLNDLRRNGKAMSTVEKLNISQLKAQRQSMPDSEQFYKA